MSVATQAQMSAIRAKVMGGGSLTPAEARVLLAELASWRDSCRKWHADYMEQARRAEKAEACLADIRRGASMP